MDVNWLGLGLGLFLIAMGISFIGPHRRRRSDDPSVVKPIFDVVLYTGSGAIFVIWAIFDWAV